MTIACASDTHGANRQIERFVEALPRVDAVCFLGDCDEDAEYIEILLKDAQPAAAFFAVSGNNDPLSGRERTLELWFEKNRVLITHGHLFSVKLSKRALVDYAQKRNAGLVLFGHTHSPLYDCTLSVRLVNPGALKDGRWALLEIGDEIDVKLLQLGVGV